MTIEPIKEKLDDKIAKLNSSRVIKKITPRGDLSWYIKWVSSMFIIFAMATASADMYPYNLFLQFVGLVGIGLTDTFEIVYWPCWLACSWYIMAR